MYPKEEPEMIRVSKWADFLKWYGKAKPLECPPMIGQSFYVIPGLMKEKENKMNAYERRKRISEINGEIDQKRRLRERELQNIGDLEQEKFKIITEDQVEKLSKSQIQKTSENPDYEQIDITGVRGKRFHIQLRDPETGIVVTSLFYQM